MVYFIYQMKEVNNMQKVKQFFGITQSYQFERMDLAAIFTVFNTIAIIVWNKGAFVGLPVNVIGLIWDLRTKPHINNVVMRLALIVMNIYFLTL